MGAVPGDPRQVRIAARAVIVVALAAVLVGPARGIPVVGAAEPAAVPLAGYGTATLDGRLGAGEWDRADTLDLMLPVPAVDGAGKVPVTLLVMNDEANLYMALRTGRVTDFVGFWLQFNNDDDGSLVFEDGDDEVGATIDGDVVRFYDAARFWCLPPDLGQGTWCGPLDDATGPEYPVAGTIDGGAAAARPDGTTVIEMVHPLASGDARDFSLHAGSTVGFQLRTQLVSRSGGFRCDEQWALCSTWGWTSGRIAIRAAAEPAPQGGPEASATLDRAPGHAGWLSDGTTARIVGAPGTAAITYWSSVPEFDAAGRSSGGASRAAVTIPGTQAVVPIDTEGTTMLHYFASGGDGRAGPWQTIAVRIDRTAPAVTRPYVSFLSPSTLGVGAGSSRVTWAGVDALSGVVRYELQESRANGPFVTVASGGLASGQVTRRLTVGVAYRYRVRAFDVAGNVSTWMTGPGYRVSLVDSTDARLVLAGRWRTAPASSAVGGSTVYSTASGATAKLRFYGSAVAWVARTGAGHGAAVVGIDGRQRAYLSTATPAAAGRVAWATSWSAPGWHTIEVRVVGTPGHPRVDVDGFLVIEPAGSGGGASTVQEIEALATSTSPAGPAPLVEEDSSRWSGGRQLVWPATRPGWMWLHVPIGQAGRFRTVLYASAGPDRGRIEVHYSDRAATTAAVDLYAPRAAASVPLQLGVVDVSGPGWMQLAIRVTGRNPASTGFTVGLDRIVLVPVP